MLRRIIIFALVLAAAVMPLSAQQYTGMTGLIQTPSAEMDASGDARLGGQFMPRQMLPSTPFKYPSGSFYMSLTPFPWVELGYAITLMKGWRGPTDPHKIGYYHKDQYFSLKVSPLKEGRWWPAVAIGCNDPFSGRGEMGGSYYFGNFYGAATKHFTLKGQTLGVTLAYRHWRRKSNDRWNGLTAGLRLRPSFYDKASLMAEWTGSEVNIGADCLLVGHLLAQVALFDCRYFTGGLCYRVNLF